MEAAMQVHEVESALVEILRDVQKKSGRECGELNSHSRPLGDLEGFDSLSAVEVTVAVEQKLGCRFKTDSIFTSDDGKRALNLKQISLRVAKALSSEESTK
jgi:acyl carrier protein